MKKKQHAVAPVASVAPVVEVSVEVESSRSVDKLAKLFHYNPDNTVTLEAESKLTAPELVTFLSDRIVAWGSESIRLANTLRLARMLPPVKEPVFTLKDGQQVQTGEIETEAFRWTIEKLKANSATASTFANIVYLIPAIDVKENNAGLLPESLSVFAVKNALGWLKDKGVIDEKTMKLDPVKSVTDPVVAKLKEGVAASKLSKDLRELRKPTPAPATPAGTPAASGNPEVAKGEDTPDKVALDLTLIVGRVDKLNVSVGVDKVRASITGAVRDLAKLAGFELTPIK